MKIVVGISGASGSIYAGRLIDFLKTTPHEVVLTASENALSIGQDEIGVDYRECGYPFYASHDFTAPFASGSARYDAMVIIPCSMGTLGRIAHGTSEDLMARAADVFLKERRKLILVPRETPLSLIHIENMRLVTLAGGVILPAIPSFYSMIKRQPQSGVEGEALRLGGPMEGATRVPTIEGAVDTVIARVLDHLGIENQLRPRYG